MMNYILLNITPPVNTHSSRTNNADIVIFILLGLIIFLCIMVLMIIRKHSKDSNSDNRQSDSALHPEILKQEEGQQTDNGAEQQDESQKTIVYVTNQVQEQKSGHGFLKFIVSVGVIVALAFGISILADFATQNNGESPTNRDGYSNVLRRSASKKDVDAAMIYYGFGFTVLVKPNVDISDLELTFHLCAGSVEIANTVIFMGDLEAGEEYSKSISSSNITVNSGSSIIEILNNLNNLDIDYTVTSGTVSWF